MTCKSWANRDGTDIDAEAKMFSDESIGAGVPRCEV